MRRYAITRRPIGIGSMTFCLAAKAMWQGLQRTIDCSSKPFSTDIEPAFPGGISPSVLAIGGSCISASVDALGNPVDLMLTPGQAHDLACAEPLLEEADPEALIGDKAYDADQLLDTLAQREITPVIPPKANRKTPRTCDFALYCERNLVERFFNKLKHFRAIATRYDKLARNFLAGVQLACAIILLN